MYALNRLSTDRNYLISNYPGMWYFLRVTGGSAMFYKFSHNNRRITIKLALEKVEQLVWERVSLTSNLESFQDQ